MKVGARRGWSRGWYLSLSVVVAARRTAACSVFTVRTSSLLFVVTARVTVQDRLTRPLLPLSHSYFPPGFGKTSIACIQHELVTHFPRITLSSIRDHGGLKWVGYRLIR